MLYLLLVLFQIKHFVADFLLQNKWMLHKFDDDWGFFIPLLAHASINGAFTLLICLFVDSTMWWLCLVDVVSHFIIDRIKSGKKYLGRFHAMSASEMSDNLEVLYTEKIVGSSLHTKGILRAIKHNTYFWWCVGFDFFLHQLIYIFTIYMLIS